MNPGKKDSGKAPPKEAAAKGKPANPPAKDAKATPAAKQPVASKEYATANKTEKAPPGKGNPPSQNANYTSTKPAETPTPSKPDASKEKQIAMSEYQNPSTPINVGAYDTIGDKDSSFKLEDPLSPSNKSEDTSVDQSKNLLAQKENDLSQMKKVMAEKKELQTVLASVKKERDELKKKIGQQDELINICMKEVEDSTKQIEILNVQKINSDAKISELENQVEQAKKKLEETELDFLIKIEEYEEKNLELEKTNAKLMNRLVENLQSNDNNDTATLNQDEKDLKIKEVQEQYSSLIAAYFKLTEERNFEITYFQKEIEKLNAAIEESLKKDTTIKNLNQQIKDTESLVEELKEQLAVFSQASTMMDNLIYEKNELESQLLKMKEDQDNFKNEIYTNDLLIEEYENTIKISNDLMTEKDNSILQINNTLSTFKQTLEDYEKKEKNLLNVITELKTENKIMREEISKVQNVNVDEILNKNVNTNSRLKTLERKKVLKHLSDIDIFKMNMKNTIIHSMIPKKIFELGSWESFDKFLQVRSLRKKTLTLMFNIMENDLIDHSKDVMDESLSETNKTYMNFIKHLLQILLDFNILLHSLEVIFSQYDQEKFKTLGSNKNLLGLWTNISIASQFLDNLITLIKDDSFSVKYQYDGLRSIVKTLKEDIASGKIAVDFKNLETIYPIISYENQILNNTLYMLLNYKEDFFRIHQDKSLVNTLDKIITACYKKVRSTLKDIDKRFFIELNYGISNKIFDLENSFYKKLIESGKDMGPSSPENKNEDIFLRYDTVAHSLSKTCLIVSSLIEKTSKELSVNNNSSSTNVLPVQIWTDITLEVYNELDAGIKVREALEAAEAELKQLKFEKVNLESKIEEMLKTKRINDQKLAEALVGVGKLAQLEAEIEEKNKKIEKYNTTVEALIKNIEAEQEKNKELKSKLDSSGASNNFFRSISNANQQFQKESQLQQQQQQQQLQQQEGRSSGVKRAAFIGNSSISSSNPPAQSFSINNTFIADSVPLLNTIFQLQRERRLLKTKITKEKVDQLLYDQNSYINKYIQKNSKKVDDVYNVIEDPVCKINENFKKVRKDLCLSKVYDITDPNYNYEKTVKIQDNQIKQLRIDYMQDIDKILNVMFADHSLDGSFKNFIDKDIKRYN